MSKTTNPNFDFVKILNEDKTYKLLFPEREVGLAIVLIFEKIENKIFEDGKFTEKDLHEAFEQIYITKGVPIESVSKMLGHKSIKTTQHYAKILDKKVSEDMLVLKNTLQKKDRMKKLG